MGSTSSSAVRVSSLKGKEMKKHRGNPPLKVDPKYKNVKRFMLLNNWDCDIRLHGMSIVTHSGLLNELKLPESVLKKGQSFAVASVKTRKKKDDLFWESLPQHQKFIALFLRDSDGNRCTLGMLINPEVAEVREIKSPSFKGFPDDLIQDDEEKEYDWTSERLSRLKVSDVSKMSDTQVRRLAESLSIEVSKWDYPNRRAVIQWIAHREADGRLKSDICLIIDDLKHSAIKRRKILPLSLQSTNQGLRRFGLKNVWDVPVKMKDMRLTIDQKFPELPSLMFLEKEIKPGQMIAVCIDEESCWIKGDLRWSNINMDDIKEGTLRLWINDNNGNRRMLGVLHDSDKQYPFQIELSMILMNLTRQIFGELELEHCGFFFECILPKIVYQYAHLVSYPPGSCDLEGHNGRVNAVVLTTDGTEMYTVSSDKCIIHWDLRKNVILSLWIAHTKSVECIDYYCDYMNGDSNHLLASGSRDSDIKIWDACSAHQCIYTLTGHGYCVNSVQFHNDGHHLISASSDKTIRLWSLKKKKKNGECIRVFDGHEFGVLTVRFMMMNDIFVAADLRRRKRKKRTRLSSSKIISGSEDESIKVWDCDKGLCLLSKKREETDGFYAIAVNMDGSRLVCCSEHNIFIFSWPEMEEIDCRDKGAYAACFHPWKPDLFAVAYTKSKNVGLLSLSDDSFEYNFPKIYENQLTDLHFTPDARRLIVTSRSSVVRVIDLDHRTI